MTKKVNVKLLRKIQKHILAEPKRIDMHTFIARKNDPNTAPASSFPQCGTVGCIAGWAVTLSTKQRVSYDKIAELAAKLLGISGVQKDTLFYVAFWPSQFLLQLGKSQTKKHAEVVAERIEHFINTGE